MARNSTSLANAKILAKQKFFFKQKFCFLLIGENIQHYKAFRSSASDRDKCLLSTCSDEDRLPIMKKAQARTFRLDHLRAISSLV